MPNPKARELTFKEAKEAAKLSYRYTIEDVAKMVGSSKDALPKIFKYYGLRYDKSRTPKQSKVNPDSLTAGNVMLQAKMRDSWV